MLSEQEKKLLAQAEARVKQNAQGGLEKYLKPEAREKVRDHPARTPWSIHFHTELSKRSEGGALLDIDLLDEAYRMADAAVAYDLLGPQAFDNQRYLSDRKTGAEFIQFLQRYRLRLNDPGIKSILLKMAQQLCVS